MIARTFKPVALFFALTTFAVIAIGCDGAGSHSAHTGGTITPGERLWRSRCGNCHTRIEPGTRSREGLDIALQRHRRRVRLSEHDWATLTNFLMLTPESPAPRAPNAAPATSCAPDAVASSQATPALPTNTPSTAPASSR